MTTNDMDIFTQIIPDYRDYMLNNTQWTMMVRIYAILKAEGKYWMLMHSWIPLKFPALYDLKGSFFQRTGEGKDLKDNNWIKDKMQIKLAPAVRERVLKAIQEDAKFLGDRKLLGYSLIIGHRKFMLPKCGSDHFAVDSKYANCKAPVCAQGLPCVDAAAAVE